MLLKVAATDFSFLLDSCRRCFHHKVVHNWRKPYTPFPSVFGRIDKLQRETYADRPIELNGIQGVLRTKTITVKSVPIQIAPGIEIQIGGRTDALHEQANNQSETPV